MTRRLPLLFGVLALLLVGCSGDPAGDCGPIPGVRTGLCVIPEGERLPAPTDPAPQLGGDGEEVSVAVGAGELLVVNFWGSWCGPCRVEQPELNAVAARLEDAVTFLGVNVQDSTANALAYVREFDVPYPSVHDPDGAYAASFGGIGPAVMPSTVLIDREGRVAVRIFGQTSATELTVLAERVLTGAGSARG